MRAGADIITSTYLQEHYIEYRKQFPLLDSSRAQLGLSGGADSTPYSTSPTSLSPISRSDFSAASMLICPCNRPGCGALIQSWASSRNVSGSIASTSVDSPTKPRARVSLCSRSGALAGSTLRSGQA